MLTIEQIKLQIKYLLTVWWQHSGDQINPGYNPIDFCGGVTLRMNWAPFSHLCIVPFSGNNRWLPVGHIGMLKKGLLGKGIGYIE